MSEEQSSRESVRTTGIGRLKKGITIAIVSVAVLYLFTPKVDYLLRIYLGIPRRPRKLSAAIKMEDIETISWYISRGTNLNAVPPREEEGCYPLVLACTRGEYAIARLLLDHGASTDPEYPDGDSMTDKRMPLGAAAVAGDEMLLTLLLERGAKIDGKDGWGRTAMHWAALNSEEMVEALAREGAQIDAKDDLGMTPLHVAVVSGKTGIVECLLALGDDLNERDAKGRNCLHFCTHDCWMTETLLSAGADPNVTGDMDVDLIVVEVWSNGLRYSPYPLAYGLDPAHCKGWTVLHCGAAIGKTDYVSLLLENGARTDIKDAEGKTPLDIARETGRTEVVSLLEKWIAEHSEGDGSRNPEM